MSTRTRPGTARQSGSQPEPQFLPRSLSRRGFLLGTGATAATAALALAGCSSDDSDKGSVKSDTKGSGSPTASGTAAAGAFPVTVKGTPGSTTVKAAPKRVAACGYLRDTDLALALGAPLVLAARNAVFPSGLAPWQKPTTSPELVGTTDGLPLEKIAAARPDLILASDDYQLATDYAKLTKIAPTLAYGNGVGKDGWDLMAQRAGDVLGKRAEADKLITDVRAKIAQVKSEHPEFTGKTFTFGPVGADGSVYTTSSTADAAATFFHQLGLELSPKVTKLPPSATPGRSQIARERLDLLDADVVILTYPDEATRKKFESDALFKRLPAVKRGSYIPLDMPTAIALAFPSVLSIPYGLDAVTPKLATAVKNGA
ncbi:iron-siderophore ABC transporter substrate-binding protein [Actinacidiphila alni]|uniref:iron-siderophore ABC transporter substrate-binding protein n=1 Tax=Actinacidiphila alni TaxID=380248 RepID=UPI003452BD71